MKLPHGLTSTTLAILLDRALNGDPTPKDAKVLADVVGALESFSAIQQTKIDQQVAEIKRLTRLLNNRVQDVVDLTRRADEADRQIAQLEMHLDENYRELSEMRTAADTTVRLPAREGDDGGADVEAAES